MAVSIIKRFSVAQLSEDGKALLVTAEFSDGTSVVLEAPFFQAEWLAKVIFSVAHTALELQKRTGEIQGTITEGEALVTERIRLSGRPHESRLLVEAIGSWLSNGAQGISTLLIDTAQASAFADDLLEFLRTAPTLSRPS